MTVQKTFSDAAMEEALGRATFKDRAEKIIFRNERNQPTILATYHWDHRFNWWRVTKISNRVTQCVDDALIPAAIWSDPSRLFHG